MSYQQDIDQALQKDINMDDFENFDSRFFWQDLQQEPFYAMATPQDQMNYDDGGPGHPQQQLEPATPLNLPPSPGALENELAMEPSSSGLNHNHQGESSLAQYTSFELGQELGQGKGPPQGVEYQKGPMLSPQWTTYDNEIAQMGTYSHSGRVTPAMSDPSQQPSDNPAARPSILLPPAGEFAQKGGAQSESSCLM